MVGDRVEVEPGRMLVGVSIGVVGRGHGAERKRIERIVGVHMQTLHINKNFMKFHFIFLMSIHHGLLIEITTQVQVLR